MESIRTLPVFLSSLLLGAALLLPAAPAAAAGCEGSSCTGKIAAEQGCTAGAYAIVGFTLNNPEVTQQTHGDLWYSPTCKAMWGDFNVPEAYFGLVAQLWTQPEYGGVNDLAAIHGLDGPGNWTTPMVDWQQSVKFCGTVRGNIDPDMDLPSNGLNACTAWR